MSFVFAPALLRFVRGTTWSDRIQLKDDAGTPVSLADIDYLLMRVREDIESSAVIIELSVANERLVVADEDLGLVDILVSAEDTLLFPVNDQTKAKYVYDAVIGRGGTPEVIEPGYAGKVVVLPQVTRKLTEPV